MEGRKERRRTVRKESGKCCAVGEGSLVAVVLFWKRLRGSGAGWSVYDLARGADARPMRLDTGKASRESVDGAGGWLLSLLRRSLMGEGIEERGRENGGLVGRGQ